MGAPPLLHPVAHAYCITLRPLITSELAVQISRDVILTQKKERSLLNAVRRHLKWLFPDHVIPIETSTVQDTILLIIMQGELDGYRPAASNDYFHYSLIIFHINRRQVDVLRCCVLSTAQRYPVYSHRGVKKPEKNHT